MIIVTDKMKESVDDYPVQFLIERSGPVNGGIIPDTVYANEKIAGKDVPLAIVESYDVGKVVVLKILHIHIENIIVRAEYYVNIAHFPDLAARNEAEPGRNPPAALENELNILCIVPYHNGLQR